MYDSFSPPYDFHFTFPSLSTTFSFPKFEYCLHCGAYHQGLCHKIKVIEYYPNGMIKKVEYYSENLDAPKMDSQVKFTISADSP